MSVLTWKAPVRPTKASEGGNVVAEIMILTGNYCLTIAMGM